MKIEDAVPCRGVEALADGTYVAIGVESNGFGVPSLPQQIATMLLVCVAQSRPDEQGCPLTVRVLNPTMEPCADELQTQLSVGRTPLLPEGWCSRMLLPVQMVWLAEAYGGTRSSWQLGTRRTVFRSSS